MAKKRSDLARRAESARRRLVNLRARLKRIHTELGEMPTIRGHVTNAYCLVEIARLAAERAAVILGDYVDIIIDQDAQTNAESF